MSQSLWQGANYDAGSLFFFLPFFFIFPRPITLSFWARKSDVSGADKLRSDWKVSATWVESRLGEIPICVHDEEGGRERKKEERQAKDDMARGFLPFEL